MTVLIGIRPRRRPAESTITGSFSGVRVGFWISMSDGSSYATENHRIVGFFSGGFYLRREDPLDRFLARVKAFFAPSIEEEEEVDEC